MNAQPLKALCRHPIARKCLKIAFWKIGVLERYGFHLALLAARIYAGIFLWKSGWEKYDYREGALQAFQYDYIPNWEAYATRYIGNFTFTFPVPSAETALCLTLWAEIVFALMLWAGLGGRIAAFGLFIMALIMEMFIYPGTVEHHYWMLLSAILMTTGPGRLSVDRYLRLVFKKCLTDETGTAKTGENAAKTPQKKSKKPE